MKTTVQYRVPCICRFFGISIHVYWREHAPAHFHAQYGDDEVSIRIDNLGILEGRMTPRCLGMVLEWAALHQAELRMAWDQAVNHQQPRSIEPLK